jgi:hypothetical protein
LRRQVAQAHYANPTTRMGKLMKDNVKKEVEHLKQMARNWKRGFEKNWLVLGEDNDHVYREFLDEMETFLYPYARRLVEMQHITQKEAEELAGYFYSQILELKAISDLAQWEKNNPIVTTL